MSAKSRQNNKGSSAAGKKRADKISSLIFILILMAGLSLLLYPKFADYWNSLHQSQAIASYADVVAEIDNSANEAMIDAARKYNIEVAKRASFYFMTEEQEAEYNSLLDITGTGIMGYVEIPSIKVALPIYHGTSEGVLQVATGHLEWSSLPVGGINTHAVLSGHRGLPSAKLFTDLDRLLVGDTFLIRVLNEIFTYEVDQILIVEPSEMDNIKIEEGKDLCTLVTCTPYGINSHRMLVRGHRIANIEAAKTLTLSAEATLIDPRLVAGAIAMPILFVLLVITMFSDSRARQRRRTMREFRRR